MNPPPKRRSRSEYSEKLRDPRWQKLRLQVFERDEWACQLCFDSESSLAVHHRYYTKGKEPWEYPLEALVTLCESCHTAEYEGRPEAERALVQALREKEFFASDIQALAEAFQKMELLHIADVVSTVYAQALARPDIQRRLIDEYFAELKAKREQSKPSPSE